MMSPTISSCCFCVFAFPPFSLLFIASLWLLLFLFAFSAFLCLFCMSLLFLCLPLLRCDFSAFLAFPASLRLSYTSWLFYCVSLLSRFLSSFGVLFRCFYCFCLLWPSFWVFYNYFSYSCCLFSALLVAGCCVLFHPKGQPKCII